MIITNDLLKGPKENAIHTRHHLERTSTSRHFEWRQVAFTKKKVNMYINHGDDSYDDDDDGDDEDEENEDKEDDGT